MRAALRSRPWPAATVLAAASVAALAACGSSVATPKASPSTTGQSAQSAPPGSSFATAAVAGLGTVVVDGRGRTVYLLTTGAQKNVPCDDASGCTKVWPDLPLPDGSSGAKAGSGLQPSLLSTMKLADGETYPTYNGYLMYEYVGDSGPGQAKGQGVQSFGGTWYVISATGAPITTAAPAA